MRTFYGGLNDENRSDLDLAFGGVFLKIDIEKAWELLDSKLANKESWESNLGNKGKTKTDYDCVRKF